MSEFNFTKASLDALPSPTKGWVYHRDLKVRGLYIGVGSTGKKTFLLYRKLKGKPERITIGPYPDLSIEKARGKASELNAAIANGSNPAEVKRGITRELTFSELFTQYIQYHAKVKKVTWKEDEQRYKQYLEKSLANKRISSIDRREISGIHSKITASGHPVVANRVLALISSVFGWALSQSYIESNPAKGIKRNKEQGRERFLQPDELPKFFQALNKEENLTVKDFILVSLLTGARRTNVLEMRWDQISLVRKEWHIKLTKNGTPHTVTLAPEIVAILENRKAIAKKSPYVFPGNGKTGHLAEPYKGWQRLLSRAGLSNLRIHDLRRTLGSWQAREGASLAIIGKSLNHKDPSTTAIYARLDLDPVRQSVNNATSAIMKAAGADNQNKRKQIRYSKYVIGSKRLSNEIPD